MKALKRIMNNLYKSFVDILILSKIELYKLFKCKIIWVTIVIMTGLIIAFASFLKADNLFNSEKTKEQVQLEEKYTRESDWKKKLEIEMQLNNQLTSIYGKNTVSMKNSLLQYRIDNNIKPPTDKNNTWNFTQYVFKIMGSLLVLFSIYVFTELVSNEYNNNTAKTLFTRPFLRNEIAFAKYLTASVYLICTSIFIFIISYIIGGIVFSYNGGRAWEIFYLNNRITMMQLFQYTILYWLGVTVNAIIISTFAFFLCWILRSQIASFLIAAIIYSAGGTVATKLYSIGVTNVKYLYISYLNTISYIDSSVPKDFTPKLGIIVIILHTILFYILSDLYLRKKDI